MRIRAEARISENAYVLFTTCSTLIASRIRKSSDLHTRGSRGHSTGMLATVTQNSLKCKSLCIIRSNRLSAVSIAATYTNIKWNREPKRKRNCDVCGRCGWVTATFQAASATVRANTISIQRQHSTDQMLWYTHRSQPRHMFV